MTNEKICCFTGHRSIPSAHVMRIPEILAGVIKDLASKGVKTFKAGGATGFDTFAALKVIDARQKYPELGTFTCSSRLISCPVNVFFSIWSATI